MSQQELLYDHNFGLIFDLINRHMKFHYPSEEDEEEVKSSQKLERKTAGEFLL